MLPLSTTWIASLLAGTFAMACGACLSSLAYASMQRKAAAANALAASRRDRWLLRLKRGVTPLLGVSRRMTASVGTVGVAAEYACDALEERSIRVSADALVSLMLSASILLGVAAFLLTMSPAFGLALGAGSFVAAIMVLKGRSEKRDERMREEVPDAIRSLAVAFRSGHSLPQVLASSSEECGGYVGRLFGVASDRLEMGEGSAESLSVLERSNRIPELTFVAVALDIQHQSGGAIGPVLEAAIASVECELNLLRNLRVQTAQVKLSATIVTIMPFILIACFSMLSPDFLSPFFSSALGLAVFAIAISMQVMGVMAVRRMLKVDVS